MASKELLLRGWQQVDQVVNVTTSRHCRKSHSYDDTNTDNDTNDDDDDTDDDDDDDGDTKKLQTISHQRKKGALKKKDSWVAKMLDSKEP